jgi:hypothetical protein
MNDYPKLATRIIVILLVATVLIIASNTLPLIAEVIGKITGALAPLINF